MNTQSRSLFALLLGSAVVLTPACAKKETTAVTSAASAAPAPAAAKRYPLKGVVVDILADQSSLLVKHEEIPGYMMAMTMMFKVDDATLKAATKGQAITGTLVERDDGFWLEDVKPAR